MGASQYRAFPSLTEYVVAGVLGIVMFGCVLKKRIGPERRYSCVKRSATIQKDITNTIKNRFLLNSKKKRTKKFFSYKINSPIEGSRVKPFTPLPKVTTSCVELPYMQYPAAMSSRPGRRTLPSAVASESCATFVLKIP